MNKLKPIQGVLFFIMKATLAQMFVMAVLTTLASAANLSGQGILDRKVSLTVKNQRIESILAEIEKQASVAITYNVDLLEDLNLVTLRAKNTTIGQVLERLFTPDIDFVVIHNEIVLKPSLSDKVNSDSFLSASGKSAKDAEGRFSLRNRQTIRQDRQDEIIVKGKVTSTIDPAGLPGVNIIVKGTTIGTVTDNQGDYIITVPSREAVLVFSSIGFITEEIQVGNNTVLDVLLGADIKALEEIVVVGYSEQSRASLSTAVSTVQGKELINQSTGDVRKALQGTVPGLTIVDQGGAPGQQNVSIRIRGISSVNNTDPLVLVDGMEQQLTNVDANAIESITVLKDAASTAIYGSRGANGVILITTIKGSEGKLKIAYNGFYGTSYPTRWPDPIDTRGYMEMQNLAFANSRNPTVPFPDIDEYLERNRQYPELFPKAFPDNSEFFQWAPLSKHSLVVSGGTKAISSMFNIAYEDQGSIIPGSQSDRIQLRSNNNFTLSKNIKSFINVSYNRLNALSPRTAWSDNQFNPREQAPFYYQLMFNTSEFQNQRFPDGTYGFSNKGENIWYLTDRNYQGTRNLINDDLVLSSGFDVKFLKKFTYRASYLVNFNNDMVSDNLPRFEIRNYWNENSTVARRDINEYSENRRENIRTTLNSLLSYDNTWGDHTVNVLLGYSEDAYKGTGVFAQGRDFYNNDIRNLSQGDPELRTIQSSFSEWGLRSYFGRAAYSFKDKYFVEVNGRYDGSSRFPKGNKYAFFPSASVAWRLSEENFWSSLQNTISDFKLRYSYGVTGSQNIDNYSYIPRLSVQNNYAFFNTNSGGETLVTGVGQRDLASTELTWETTSQHNVGVDMSFMSGKLTFSLDVFRKITDGILLDVPVPAVIGLNPSKTNAGIISNKGWESVITYRGQVNSLKFDISANASFVADRVEDFGGLPNQFLFNQRYYRGVGTSLFALNGFKFDGFYRDQEDIDNSPARGNRASLFPGDVKYKDLSGPDGVPDGIINNEDFTDLGYGVPRYFYGLVTNLDWKGLDLNMLWQGAGGHHVPIFGKVAESGGYGGWMPAYSASDFWTGPEDVNARFPIPRQNPGNNIQSSDFWLVKGDYFRLKSITLGYTLPSALTSRIRIEKVRVYTNAINPFAFSKLYKDWQLDPEGRIGSLRYDYFPQIRSYNVGLMLTF